MSTARYILCVLLAIALARPACAAELTADEVIDRMVAGNSAWLKPDLKYLSYSAPSVRKDGGPVTFSYRAPGDLRVEWEKENEEGAKWRYVFRDGRRISPEPGDCGTGYVRDLALQPVIFAGACWALANNRDKCQLLDLRHELVEGRRAYHVAFKGYTPSYFPTGVPALSDCHDHRDLWIDAETFRPLREAWDHGCTGPSHYRVLRYADWQPFPGGGEAPMRLEEWGWPDSLPFDAEPRKKPYVVLDYQVVAGKYWVLKTVRRYTVTPHEYDLWRSADISDLSVAPLPDKLFEVETAKE